MKAGDKVEVSVSHITGTAEWLAARVKSVNEARGIADVVLERAPVRFSVALTNVRPRGDA